jgi:CMP-N-acetylneuraminic acid synthetase
VKLLCVIPARGGSKRIPDKNRRAFAGRPMLTHALRAALNSGVFHHVHVSTDSAQIAALAEQAGAKPAFFREPALADDHTPIRDVVRADFQTFLEREPYDGVALVYATAALLEADDLSKAASRFMEDISRPLLGVVPAEAPLERFLAIRDGVLEPALSGERFANRTQDLTTVYRDAGAFAFYAAETLLADTYGAAAMAFRPFVLPAYKAVDIDTEDDWRQAEIIKAGLTALGG